MAKTKNTLTPDQIRDEINVRKQLLIETDYKALKFAEGSISAEDYEETKVQRQTWRDEINEFEKQLEEV